MALASIHSPFLLAPFPALIEMKKSRRRRQTDTSKEDLLHPIIRKIPNTTIGARAFVMIADLCNNGKELGDNMIRLV